MNKMTIIISVIAVLALITVGIVTMTGGGSFEVGNMPASGAANLGPATDLGPADAVSIGGPGSAGMQLAPAQFISAASSAEEAEKIAKLYGIELVEYSETGQIATYKTDKDPAAVVKMGADKNYPKLEYNFAGSLNQ